MKVEFFKHNIEAEDIANVTRVLNSIFLTTGEVVEKFEQKFARYLSNEGYAVGLTSCTGALHLSLLALGVEPGDEVITTPFTFVATSNAIIQVGAIPVFVDVEEDTGNISAERMESAITSRTKAIVPVHLYGQMCDMRKLRKICDTHNLILVEDAAHAIEAQRDGIRPGELGDTACFSFYTTKSITCGEGGAVLTNNPKIAEKLKRMRHHGIDKGAAERYTTKYRHWDMKMFGWKYNMDNIQAALLLNQLENIDWRWKKREEIARIYEKSFKNNPRIKLLKELPNSKNARHLFPVFVPHSRRDEILWQLQERGIGVAVNYHPLHLLSYYKERFNYKRGDFPIAEKLGDSTVSLPFYPKLSPQEVDYVIATFRDVVC